jgi:glycosyltransferase involved in cell wall biosynthesis
MDLPAPFTLLQITPALDTGGVERTTLDIAEAVVKAGGRAFVASRGGRLEDELKALGGELVRLPMESKNPLVQMGAARALADLIRTEHVDLVHVRSRAPAFAGIWAARQTHRPVVTTYHGVYNAKTPIKRWYNGVMTRGDITIANSDFTRAHILKTYPKLDPASVVSIPRGVDLRKFDPALVEPGRVAELKARFGAAEGRTLFLLAGRLTRWKGQELAIEAFGMAKMGGAPPISLALAGDDQGRTDYVEGLKGRIALAGLDDAVRLVGHCTDMPAAYLACDVALNASIDPEAFGRTAVEPQAMGRPVVAADHGGTAETVEAGRTGWLFTPGSATALAVALTDAALASPQTREAMGQAGQARVRALYSLEVMARSTLEVYARLCSRSHA